MKTVQKGILEVEVEMRDDYHRRAVQEIVEKFLSSLENNTDMYALSCKILDDDYGGDWCTSMLVEFTIINKTAEINDNKVLNLWNEKDFMALIKERFVQAGYTVLADNRYIRKDEEVYLEDIDTYIEREDFILQREEEVER